MLHTLMMNSCCELHNTKSKMTWFYKVGWVKRIKLFQITRHLYHGLKALYVPLDDFLKENTVCLYLPLIDGVHLCFHCFVNEFLSGLLWLPTIWFNWGWRIPLFSARLEYAVRWMVPDITQCRQDVIPHCPVTKTMRWFWKLWNQLYRNFL